jgi:uncharacterized membrane protein (UPF0127 family)
MAREQLIRHSRRDRQVKKSPVLVVLAVAVAGAWACRQSAQPQVCFHVAGGQSVCLRVELAVSAEERGLGLMYRRTLGREQGMLFVFDDDADHAFTMRNTEIPLAMIFIDRDGCVTGCIDAAAPMSPGPYTIGAASRYVVETRAGFCARVGLVRGDRAEGVNLPVRTTF